MGQSVLNDAWISVPTGSEEYGFRSARKNQYEEMLYKCEEVSISISIDSKNYFLNSKNQSKGSIWVGFGVGVER